MHKTVLRVAPVTQSNLTAMSHHHARTHSETDVHVDHDLSKNNLTLIGSGDPESDVKELAAQYRQAKKSDDPIVAAEYILTAGKEYFDKDFPDWKSDSSVLQPWIDANLDFIRSKSHIIGEPVSAVLHLDEEAPHIHLATVPVADIRIANRYASRTEKRISYSALLYDEKSTLAEARRLGRVDTDTKLGRIQTLYADDMQSHGLNLERGVSQSGAVHVSPGQHRADISRPVPNPDQIKTKEDVISLINQAQALANERKILMKENTTLTKNLTIAQKSIMEKTNEQIREDKELLKHYRSLSEQDLINAKFATYEEIKEFKTQSKRSKFNAIDFTMHKTGGNAVASAYVLAEHFPSERIAEVAAQRRLQLEIDQGIEKAGRLKGVTERILDGLASDLEDTTSDIEYSEMTQSDRVKASAIKKQLTAIQAPSYRLTLMHPTDKAKTYNVGKGKGQDGTEKLWTADEVQTLIPTLSYRNAHNYNIFITPMPTQTTHFILLDDIRDLDKAKKDKPCLILQTSPNSQQALYRINGTHKDAIALSNAINTENGDPGLNGQVHPMRLAGFTNRKSKYKDKDGMLPFVRILAADGCDSPMLTERAKNIQHELQRKQELHNKSKSRSGMGF